MTGEGFAYFRARVVALEILADDCEQHLHRYDAAAAIRAYLTGERDSLDESFGLVPIKRARGGQESADVDERVRTAVDLQVSGWSLEGIADGMQIDESVLRRQMATRRKVCWSWEIARRLGTEQTALASELMKNRPR